MEGCLLAGGLIVVGLLLQLIIGPVDWNAFRWPVNGIVLAGFLGIVAVIFLLRKRMYVFRFLGTFRAAVPALVLAVLLTVVMGLTRQTNDGMWFSNMLAFWPFVLASVYIAVILGQVIFRQLWSWATARFSLSAFHFSLLLHLGLFVAMTTATLGNADMQRLKLIAVKGVPEWRAIDAQGMVHVLPLTIELKQFVMETYDDGSPKRFASDVLIYSRKTKSQYSTTIDVNAPAEADGWKIYQYGYDTQLGALSNYSVFELVSDPWLPLVYAGIYMMLAGAGCMFVFGSRKGKES